MLGRTVARNSFLTMMDVVVGLTVTLFTAGIVARALGPEKMGDYGFAIWLVVAMIALGTGGTGAAVRKFLSEAWGQGDFASAQAIARAALIVQTVTAIVLTAIGMAFVWWQFPPGHRLFNALALLSAVPVLMQVVPTAVNSAAEDFSSNVRAGIVCTLLQPLGILLALGFRFHGKEIIHSMELVGLSAGLLIARTADACLRFYFSRNRFPKGLPVVRIPADLRRRMIHFCLQAIALLVLDLIVWERCEVFFLERYSSKSQLAFYNCGFQLTSILMTLPSSFAWACGASLMVQKGRDPDSLNRMTAVWLRILALLVFPLTLGMAALSGPAIRIIFGPKYLPAIPVIALMAVMTIPKGLFSPAQQLLMVHEKLRFIVQWEILAAAVTLTADYILIRRYGAIGAAWGNGTAQLLAVIGIWIYAIRQEQLRLPWLTLAKTLASSVVMAAVVYCFALFLTPFKAALMGVPCGALIYVGLLRLTKGFSADDLPRLLNLESQLPSVVQVWYRRGVQWVFVQ